MPADHKQARQGILYREGQSRAPDGSSVDEYMNSASVRPRNVRWRDETAHRDRAGVRYGDQYIKQIEAIYGGEGLVEPAGSGRSEQGSLVREHGHRYRRVCDAVLRDHLMDGRRFGPRGAKVFASRRHVREQIAHGYTRASSGSGRAGRLENSR